MLTSSRARRALAIVALVFALGACSTEDVIRGSFAEFGAPPHVQEQAIQVARCESGLRWDAVSPGGGNWGMFQINRVHQGRVNGMGYAWQEMLYPWQNARVAASIWAEQGWRPWTCARHLGY